MKKLKAFRQAVKDQRFSTEIIEELRSQLRAIKSIKVGSSLTIDLNSTDNQYTYALGVLKQRLEASIELGVSTVDVKEDIDSLKTMFKLSRELQQWLTYDKELYTYMISLEELLSPTERFELLEKPCKP